MKLILFDFDGVLVDTFGIVYSLGLETNPNLSEEEYKSFFNGNIHEAKRSDGASISYRLDYEDQYKIKTRELKIPEKLKEMLRELSLDYTLAIISSTESLSITKILSREGADSYFVDILGRDVHKSKVVKIKMFLEKYGISPKDAVFITDTVGDIIEARECEVRSIAVTWGFHDAETLQKAKPEKIVNTPEDLLKSIEEILNG